MDWRRLGGIVAALAALGAALSWMAVELRERAASRAAYPVESGRLALEGVERPVRIDRDAHGVPHVQAASERDAFFALGFAEAQDRLGQLLWLRRQARGTTAEVAGPERLPADRLARLIDFRGLADAQWSGLAPSTRRVLEAFAAGIDARIERVRRGDAAPPVHLTEPRFEIEAWRPQDSLAVFKLFAWGLSSSLQASLVLSDVVEEVGATGAGRFFPPRDEGPGLEGRATAGPARPARWLEQGALALRHGLGLAGQGVGSSVFAVGGGDVEGGHPVLVADTHLEPTAPALLYLAHLRAPGRDVAGATLAGVPVFWWGRNDHLAWGCANAGVVTTDLYAEAVRADGSYHDGHRWHPADERFEVLHVRDGEDVTLRIRRTAHGPLLPPDIAGPETALAVAWTGARTRGPSGIGSLLALSRAEDGDDVVAALRGHHEPVIAVVWAGADGEVGLQEAGWIPRRSLASQLLPLPGRARWYDWKDRVPYASLASARLADGHGFVLAADQRFQTADGAEDEDAPDALWRDGVRAARLESLLRERVAAGGADLRGLAALQTDVTLDRSRALVDLALRLVGDAPRDQEGAEIERLLRAWDGRATADSAGNAVYHVWLHSVAEALFAGRLGKELYDRYLAVPSLDLEGLVMGVLTDAAAGGAGDGWSDPERVRQALGESLREAWLGLSFRLGPDPRQWTWGRIHPLRFHAPGGEVALGPFPYGGSPHAVQIADYAKSHPFDVRVAAVGRFAIDTGALDVGLVALAPGQSEHPGHPQFDEGLQRWLAGKTALLATRRLDVEDRSVARLVLEPVR